MKCYTHPDMDAVATCGDCSKGLCAECSRKYETPVCDACIGDYLTERKGELKKRLIFNGIIFSGILLLMLFSRLAADQGPSGLLFWLTMLLALTVLVWGFWGFRWLMDAFQRITHMNIFMTFSSFGMVYFIGSLVTGALAIFIAPFLILYDSFQLYRLNKKTETLKSQGLVL